jgi:hypothetical protein
MMRSFSSHYTPALRVTTRFSSRRMCAASSTSTRSCLCAALSLTIRVPIKPCGVRSKKPAPAVSPWMRGAHHPSASQVRRVQARVALRARRGLPATHQVLPQAHAAARGAARFPTSPEPPSARADGGDALGYAGEGVRHRARLRTYHPRARVKTRVLDGAIEEEEGKVSLSSRSCPWCYIHS